MFQDRERDIFDSFESFLLCVATTVVLMTQSRVHLERRPPREKHGSALRVTSRTNSWCEVDFRCVGRMRRRGLLLHQSDRQPHTSVDITPCSHAYPTDAQFSSLSSGTSRLLVRSKLFPLSRSITAEGTTCRSKPAAIVAANASGGRDKCGPTATNVPVDPPHPSPLVLHARLAAQILSPVYTQRGHSEYF